MFSASVRCGLSTTSLYTMYEAQQPRHLRPQPLYFFYTHHKESYIYIHEKHQLSMVVLSPTPHPHSFHAHMHPVAHSICALMLNLPASQPSLSLRALTRCPPGHDECSSALLFAGQSRGVPRDVRLESQVEKLVILLLQVLFLHKNSLAFPLARQPPALLGHTLQRLLRAWHAELRPQQVAGAL